MKLIYAPSAKRIIPYPPVSLAVLSGALRAAGRDATGVFDLEIMLADEWQRGFPALLYDRTITPEEVLSDDLPADVSQYGELLLSLIGWDSGQDVGISVMGFDQLASALLLGRMVSELGGRVMFGGQFFTDHSAEQIVSALGRTGRVTVAIGDGWQAVVAFRDNAPRPGPIPSTVSGRPGKIERGEPLTGRATPPEPDYGWVDWPRYERFGSRVYRDSTPVRRAHLYLWDKTCTFRCAFCRVASGSRALLASPLDAVRAYEKLVATGVRQANIMANELNPSNAYLRRFLDAMDHDDEAPDASWFSYFRADRVDAATFDHVRRVGGRLARYGVESGSQRLLDLMRKDYDVATMSATLRNSARADLWNHINLLVGFPGERDSDIDDTLRFLRENAGHINSVRINPFYLPPDTPIARDPDAFNVRLTRFDRGWWNFEYGDSGRPEAAVTTERIARIGEACVDLGLGFAGTDPFFLVDVLHRHASTAEATTYLRNTYPAFWTPAPTDFYKGLIGGYAVSSEWRDTVNQRQQNYSLSICTD